MRQALRWACVSCRAGLLVITSFPSHAAREGRGGEGRRAPSLFLVAGNTCPGSPQDLPDSQCGQGALLLLMQMGFLPNLVGGAEHPHSSPHPSDTHPTGLEGCLPPDEWEWSLRMWARWATDSSGVSWSRAGTTKILWRRPFPCPLATERGFLWLCCCCLYHMSRLSVSSAPGPGCMRQKYQHPENSLLCHALGAQVRLSLPLHLLETLYFCFIYNVQGF